jgi:hypothetical protein
VVVSVDVVVFVLVHAAVDASVLAHMLVGVFGRVVLLSLKSAYMGGYIRVCVIHVVLDCVLVQLCNCVCVCACCVCVVACGWLLRLCVLAVVLVFLFVCVCACLFVHTGGCIRRSAVRHIQAHCGR